jgi:hypothetical protein
MRAVRWDCWIASIEWIGAPLYLWALACSGEILQTTST